MPFGYAAHPYLTVGEDAVDEVTVTMPAASYLEVDDRLLPDGRLQVDGTGLDFRAGSRGRCGNARHRLHRPARDADGRWRVRLSLGERQAELWGDAAMGWVQVFTGGPYRNWSLAVEPMTCGPDAFNAGPDPRRTCSAWSRARASRPAGASSALSIRLALGCPELRT